MSGAAFSIGDHVFHQKFGVGTVVAVNGRKLIVDFYKGGEKCVVDTFVNRIDPSNAALWHCAIVTSSSVCRLGSGSALLIELETAEHKALAVDVITLASRDERAVQQGCRWLSELCHALGWKKTLTNSVELHGLRCLVLVWRGRVLSYAADPWAAWTARLAMAEAR
jgi:hypothetical protein